MTASQSDLTRLEGLRVANLNLAIACDWCGHSAVLDGPKLWRMFAVHMWKSEMSRVPEHVRCSVCKRRPTKLTPTANKPTVDPFPANEEGWQRLVRRLRG